MKTVFPGEDWVTLSPVKAGFDPAKWNAWIAGQHPKGANWKGERHPNNEWGIVLVRGGYLVRTWGNPEYRYQVSSVSKAFTKLVLQITIDNGLINSDDELVMDYWTGEGELSGQHKHLNRGHHRSLTFRHLWQHKGGFPVTNGYEWIRKKHIPNWAQWAGDPGYDNYSHIPPGTAREYSSGGYWRLTQALTTIWGRSLKEVLDDEILNKIGVSPDRWDCLTGKQIHDNINFYPEMPNYGRFVDPPYFVNEQIPVTCAWIVMSATDLARVGLLIANRGVWKGVRLVGDTELLAGHLGGNDSELMVRSGNEMTVWAKVTATDIAFPHGVLSRSVRRLKH